MNYLLDTNAVIALMKQHSHSLIVVNHNTREFQRVSDLVIEDWQS